MVAFDDFGPEKIYEVYEPRIGMHGFLVIDNTALGPGKGGIRMTPTVSVEEVSKLARAMTWKNSIAELPFGGAKAGIIADSKVLTAEQKKAIVESFSRALKPVCPSLYIAGPDMYIAEEEMAQFAKANGDMKSCTGKPASLGGIPHELGSTGFGVFHATKVAADFMGMNLNGVTVAIEGFGNVGTFVMKHMEEHGAKVVCTSDSKGTIYNKDGLDYEKMMKVKQETGSVINYKPGKVLSNKDVIGTDAEILVTAAIPDLITENDMNKIKAKLIVEGSNIPMTPAIEAALQKKGIMIIPDFVANAGGVISSYVEYKGGTAKEMFKIVEERIVKNTKVVLEHAKSERKTTRDAALEIAEMRVRSKCKTCR